MLRRCLFLICAATALLSSLAQAHVQASLVSPQAAIVPGQPLTVALRLEHEPHWHTYWVEAGTGYATSLRWDLPPGWTAGEIQWPAPIRIIDSHGTITGNGYEGVAYLPITLTPPDDLAAGSSVTLKAKADWLMCADVCIPGDASVSLTLPVKATSAPAASVQAQQAADTLSNLPRSLPGWQLSAARGDGMVTLRFTAATDTALPEIEDVWFFASDAFVQYDTPQKLSSPAPNTWELRMKIADYADADTTRLVGVLTLPHSWLPDGADVRGLVVDVPFGTLGTTTAGTDAPTAPAPDATGGTAGLLGTLTLAFVGGLILNLMPCVFPVLGIKILGFVNQSGADRRKVTMHGVTFALGVLASFWALAGVLAVLRAGGDQLGWGFQLQSPAFVFSLAAVMLIFALSMSGVFEFGLSATGVGSGLQRKDGLTGSFFTGVLATVVATPCSAPFLAPALGAALALPLAKSFAVFTAIAVGLALPYLLLSIFPQAVKILPRPGAWMETFKQVMAFPLYASVGFLVWVLAGQLSENGLLMALFALTLIAMATWLYGRYTRPGNKPGQVRFGVIGGATLLLAAMWLGWPKAAAPSDIVWEPWSTERIAALRAEGRPIYVDFTARWCATCQTNKKLVFGSDKVKARFRELNVATLKGDWTKQDPLITAELAKWNRSAVPFNLLYLPGQPEPVALPEILTPGIVLDHLP